MNAEILWNALQSAFPERSARVKHKVIPVSGSDEEFLIKLRQLSSNASIANGRCGYIGNPYEQLDEDFLVLLELARKISLKGKQS
jgi:hypothetical protein